MRKRFGSIAVVLLLLMYLVVGCTSNTASKGIYISIATGGTAGTYYPLGGALAKIFNDNIDGVNANVQSTGASVENVGLISKGEAEIAFIQNDITYYATTGTEAFEGKEKVTNLRGMAMIYPELVQIIATEESGIKTVEDLKGKKVAIGAPGSGVEANARQVLAVHGMTYDDLGKADYLSFNEAADQLKNKQIDAAFLTAGIPTSAVTEVGQTSKIVVVPIASDKISKLSEAYPFYTEVVIPADTYSGQSQDITTAAVMAMLVVSDKLEDDLVYNLTKEMFEKRQVIIDTHSRGNDLKLETALKGMPIELHPGAKRYYDEKGIK
ncbi:TAXI family TRAP transporter solute-binding subunit [Tissierella carlieri]|uniref:TAXI family TRAP transporter solute-binding subunit n=1 Tax=Tissierella carlieri TaxID=689904 RepID=A0ABT1S837_9FIRM|nr:TAXI family TRAP transporter solute-binding subunit [Tissierella carlieri]MBU5312015.1 TAXI family TRAP transporter solute-binding subunit [Tissierella carlieri]MCQ4922634.1 TAXI family TRAP transporter solute-binding subunit [Tissierella carlieri]